MGWWKELPYRGQGESSTHKRSKQFRNLRKERQENIRTILIISTIASLIVIGMIFNPDLEKQMRDGGGIILLFVVITLVTGFVRGIFTINKFKRGYDIDTSDEVEENKKKKSENDE